MTEVKVVIDGEEVQLVENGTSWNDTYAKYTEPEPYASMGPGDSPIIVSVMIKPGWTPSQE